MERLGRRPALSELVRDSVKQYILDRGLGAGDPLPPEGHLARELGVGRGSVREAIKALQSLGIVEVRHGDGLYVGAYSFDPILESLSYGMRLDDTMLAELAQIRLFLEGAAIEQAVKRIGAGDLGRLEKLMALWKDKAQAGEPDSSLDEEFHRTLYGVLNNHTFMKLFELFWTAFHQPGTPAGGDPDRARQNFETHRAILDAVKAGDAHLARQHLLRHFRHPGDAGGSSPPDVAPAPE